MCSYEKQLSFFSISQFIFVAWALSLSPSTNNYWIKNLLNFTKDLSGNIESQNLSSWSSTITDLRKFIYDPISNWSFMVSSTLIMTYHCLIALCWQKGEICLWFNTLCMNIFYWFFLLYNCFVVHAFFFPDIITNFALVLTWSDQTCFLIWYSSHIILVQYLNIITLLIILNIMYFYFYWYNC